MEMIGSFRPTHIKAKASSRCSFLWMLALAIFLSLLYSLQLSYKVSLHHDPTTEVEYLIPMPEGRATKGLSNKTEVCNDPDHCHIASRPQRGFDDSAPIALKSVSHWLSSIPDHNRIASFEDLPSYFANWTGPDILFTYNPSIIVHPETGRYFLTIMYFWASVT